jgi:ATP/maltotriose-dependent transcriptional regulator MalT
MGLVKAYAGDCREALDLFEEALVVHEQLNDRWGMGVTLLNRGLTGIGADNLELAEVSLNEAHKIFTDLKETRGSSYVLNNLGYVALLRGEFARATDLLLQSLRLKQTFNDRLGIAWSLDGLAAILARRGQFEKATYFLSAANKLRDLVCSPLTYFGHKLNTPTLTLVREGLDEETYRKALTLGYNQSLDEMLAESYSLEGSIEDRRQEAKLTTKTTQSLPIVPRSGAATEEISRSRSSSLKLIDTLTSREIEVLRTVALGLSNQQVAEKLVIAPRTVNVHLTSIYGKLGVTSRTEATRFAFENNLV